MPLRASWGTDRHQHGEATACSVAGQGAGVTEGAQEKCSGLEETAGRHGSENPAETLNRVAGNAGLTLCSDVVRKGERNQSIS